MSKDDENVVLPQAVLDAARKAEELSKQAMGENTEEEDIEEEVVEDEPEHEPETALEPEPDEELPEPDFDDEAEPVEEEEEDEPTEEEDKKETLAYWKNRCNVIQGKYNAEVPAMAQKIRELENKLNNIESLKAQDLPDTSEFDFTPEDFEDYGEEFTTLVKAFKALEQRNKHLEQLAQGFSSTQGQLNQKSFEATMDTLCPDWKELNLNQNLITWLQEPDGFSGMTKQMVLNDAAKSYDASKVAKIFNQFKKEYAIPEKKNKKPKTSLRSEVQPSTVKTETVKAKKKGREWTRPEIAQFYRDKAEGRISGKKAAELEKDIFLANQEGRILT